MASIVDTKQKRASNIFKFSTGIPLTSRSMYNGGVEFMSDRKLGVSVIDQNTYNKSIGFRGGRMLMGRWRVSIKEAIIKWVSNLSRTWAGMIVWRIRENERAEFWMS